MPTPAYPSLEGTKQGLITAGTFTEDSVGNIFQAFNHQVFIPRRSAIRPTHRPALLAGGSSAPRDPSASHPSGLALLWPHR